MELQTVLYTDHTKTSQAFQALVFFLQTGSNFIPTNCRFIITLAATTIGADASAAFRYFDKIVVFVLFVGTAGKAKLAIMHVLVHFPLLTTGQAEVIMETIAGSVKLVADVAGLARRVKVSHRQSFSHRLRLW
jgi:hypothetical protein